MTLIGHKIPEANFELIRDQIFAVLYDEFQAQLYEFSNSICNGVTFWQERFTPIDKAESAIIVISTFKGDYDNKSIGSTHGTYQYVLDFMTNRPATPQQRGDLAASVYLQRLIATVRYILEHPNYITLAFAPGFIEHTEVQKFQIFRDERTPDTSNNAVGQIIYSITCEETTTPNDGRLIGSSLTDVKVEETENGYQYLKVA